MDALRETTERNVEEGLDVLREVTQRSIEDGLEAVAERQASNRREQEKVDAKASCKTLMCACCTSCANLGIKLLMPYAKQQLQPMVEEQGLPWAPIDSLLNEVDTVEELRAIMRDPKNFMVKAVIIVAKDVTRPLVEEQGLPFEPIEKVLDEMDTMEEIRGILADPKASASWDGARALRHPPIGPDPFAPDPASSCPRVDELPLYVRL